MTRSNKHHLFASSVLSQNSAHHVLPPSMFAFNQATVKTRLRTRKKSSYKHVPHYMKPAHLVAKRNARERLRVQAVKLAFVQLSKHVPTDTHHKKLSKLKTLRLAITYIKNLRELIYQHDQDMTRGQYLPGNLDRSKETHDAGMNTDCKTCHAYSNLDNIGQNVQTKNLREEEANSLDVRFTNTIHEINSEEMNGCNRYQELSPSHESGTQRNHRTSLNNNLNEYQISEQIYPNVCSAANLPAQTCHLESLAESYEITCSAFEPSVSEIHSIIGRNMASTHCYFNDNAHQIFSQSFLSSCVPRFVADENYLTLN